jgi:hypothetical protein
MKRDIDENVYDVSTRFFKRFRFDITIDSRFFVKKKKRVDVSSRIRSKNELSSNFFEKRRRMKMKMKMKSEKKKKKRKKRKEKKEKNDVRVEQIAANKQLQMQVLVFVKKTSFRFVAKK